MGNEAPGARGAPRTICVTGMHRSGTSLATRLVQLLGVSLGDPDLLMEAGRDNPAGYWENRLVRELDDRLLAELGGSWDQPPTLTDGWADAPGLAPLRDEAAAVLDAAFGPGDQRQGPMGFKDPRCCLLLPFWRTVVSVDRVVLIVRDPAQVIDSLHVRNGFAAPHSAALWLRYLLAALHAAPDAVVLTQDELVDDLDGALVRLADGLGLPAPDPSALTAAREHLDPSLRHHDRRSAEAAGTDHDQNPVVALAAEVWADGHLDPARLDPTVAAAIREGWLRAPTDAAALVAARARAVELEERLRLQKRRWDAERGRRGVRP